MCNYRNMSMLLGITVCLFLLCVGNAYSMTASGQSSTANENDGPNKQADLIESSFYLPERSIRAQVNSRFGTRLSPFALKHLIAARLQNGDFGKRMGSEFLGKRSSMSDMPLAYDDPETVAYLLEKKMGSEFLGKR